MINMLKYIFCCLLFCFSVNLSASADNPGAARTNAQLGLTYLNKNMYPEAKNRLLTALQENPKSAVGWYSMAYYFEKTANLKLANQYYLKAISVESHSGDTYNNYGTFLCRHGEYRTAIREFLTAIAKPNYAHVDSAYENAGICAMRIPDIKLAMQYFEKAIENNPNMPYSLLNVARLNYKNGNTKAAERYFIDFTKIAGLTSQQVEQFQKQVFKK